MTTSHLATRRASRAPVLASLAVLVGAAACAGTAPSAPPSAQSQRVATPSQPATTSAAPAPPSATDDPTVPPIPSKDGALEPGTYRMAASPWSVADFTVTVPDGWSTAHGQTLGTQTSTGADIGITASVPDHVWSKACAGNDSGALAVGPGVHDLATALDVQEDSEATDPVPTRIGGFPGFDGVRIDLTVPDGFDLSPCNVEGKALQIWLSEAADANLVLFPDATVSAHIFDVNGKRQVFATQIPNTATDAERAELQAVLDSIRYGQ